MIPTHAISLRQPWCEYITRRLKGYEFRSWDLPEQWVGEWIGLHASAGIDDCRARWDIEFVMPHELPRSAIVGIVQFGPPERFWVDGSAVPWCIDEDGSPVGVWDGLDDVPGCPTYCDTHGSWSAWPIIGAHALTPIPCKGTIAPRIWPIPEAVDRQLWLQFRARPDLPDLAEPPIPGPLDPPLPLAV